ncbi:MAG TPA: ACT domain-containing protein [Patescibacteria group bacterium]|nr:ACT domain-containing protein [Patescibacteria group bacterium]
MKQVLYVKAENQPTVLPRVFQIFLQRGLTVESLSFQVTPDAEYVQLTVTVGSQAVSPQIVKLLRRLVAVTEVRVFVAEAGVMRDSEEISA